MKDDQVVLVGIPLGPGAWKVQALDSSYRPLCTQYAGTFDQAAQQCQRHLLALDIVDELEAFDATAEWLGCDVSDIDAEVPF